MQGGGSSEDETDVHHPAGGYLHHRADDEPGRCPPVPRPDEIILASVVDEALAGAWHRYLNFAVSVVGASGGVSIRELEKHITPRGQEALPIVLKLDR